MVLFLCSYVRCVPSDSSKRNESSVWLIQVAVCHKTYRNTVGCHRRDMVNFSEYKTPYRSMLHSNKNVFFEISSWCTKTAVICVFPQQDILPIEFTFALPFGRTSQPNVFRNSPIVRQLEDLHNVEVSFRNIYSLFDSHVMVGVKGLSCNCRQTKAACQALIQFYYGPNTVSWNLTCVTSSI